MKTSHKQVYGYWDTRSSIVLSLHINMSNPRTIGSNFTSKRLNKPFVVIFFLPMNVNHNHLIWYVYVHKVVEVHVIHPPNTNVKHLYVSSFSNHY